MVLLGPLMTLACFAVGGDGEGERAARMAAERFVRDEYRAVAERYEHARCRSVRTGKLEGCSDWSSEVFEATWDPAVVTAEPPRIVRVVVSAHTAEVELAYTPVAEAGRDIRPVEQGCERMVVGMEMQDGQWWVVNPGKPIVGLASLLEAYEALALGLDERWAVTASKEQLMGRERVMRNVQVLRGLRIPERSPGSGDGTRP